MISRDSISSMDENACTNTLEYMKCIRMHETFECHECTRDFIFFIFCNVDIKECLC